jgi:CRP-like cAMP-binding protein
MGSPILPEVSLMRHNRILAQLSAGDTKLIQAELELVYWEQGKSVFESGNLGGYGYFPASGVVSLLYETENGKSTEVAVTGNDGFLGVALIMGAQTTPHRAVAQLPGYAFRIKSRALAKAFDAVPGLHTLLLRYTQYLLTQMSLMAACYRHHTTDQHLCRWLISSMDLMKSNRLDISQDEMASLLGVRRESVTQAAGKLQSEDIISYRRGHIMVLDRPELEARACECYKVMKKESHRLLASV